MLSEATVEAFLTERLGAGIRGVSRIGFGDWSQAFGFTHNGAAFVVRFSQIDEDFVKDQRAAAYASPQLPIPPITALGKAFDGFYAIAPRVAGVHIDDLPGPAMQRTLQSLLAVLDAARGVDLSATRGYGGWGADGNAADASWPAALLAATVDPLTGRVSGWRERLETSPTSARPFDEALAEMKRLLPFCPEDRYLIHSDLLHFNVLVAEDRVTAIIDWGCSMYGDFLYDIAWLTFWFPWYPAWAGIDVRQEVLRHYASIGLSVPAFEERVRCYELHIGITSQAYNAFRGSWEELDRVAKHTTKVARG